MHKQTSFVRRVVVTTLAMTFVTASGMAQQTPHAEVDATQRATAEGSSEAESADTSEPEPSEQTEPTATEAPQTDAPEPPTDAAPGELAQPPPKAAAADTPPAGPRSDWGGTTAPLTTPPSPPARTPQPTVPSPPARAVEYPRFEPSLRLMTGFEYRSETRYATQSNIETHRYGFFLSQARAQLEGKLEKRIKLELSAELADAYDADLVTSSNRPLYLRDAFMNLRLKRALQITLGHFKRPVSALEHRNAGDLQVRGRGLTNDLIVEDNAWGDRGLGVQLWGKFDFLGARWALGVFDPAWAPAVASRPKGADVLARLSVEPIDGFSLGANGGFKTLDTPPFDEYETFYGVGGDIELEVSGLSVLVDALYAQLPQVAATLAEQTGFGIVALAAYDIGLTAAFTLEPVVLGEYSDASVDHQDTETVRAIAGLNLLVHETLRFMPQVEVVRWLGSSSELSPSEGTATYLMVSLAL